MPDPYDLVAQEQIREAQEKKQREEKQQADKDLAMLLNLPEFRRFMWKLIEDMGPARMNYVPGMTPEHHAFLEGQRNKGVQLLARWLEISPDTYLRMVKENQAK